MNISEKICRDAIFPLYTSMKKDQEYMNCKNRIMQNYKKLQTKLNGSKELLIVEKIIEDEQGMRGAENMQCFINGLKMGIAMMIEALN